MVAPRAVPVAGKAKNRSEFIQILEKVVPFLFHKHPQVALRKPVKQAVAVKRAKPSFKAAAEKTVNKKTAKKRYKKIQKKAAKPVRAPVTTIEVRKKVSPKSSAPVVVRAAADQARSALDEVTDAPAHDVDIATTSASAELPAKTPVVELAPKEEKKARGFFRLSKEEKSTDAKATVAALLADAQDDAFLAKVEQSKVGSDAKTQKKSGWSILKDRFFTRATAAPKEAKRNKSALSAKEIAKDSFLQRVEKKKVNDVVGTSVDAEALEMQDLANGEKTEYTPANVSPGRPTKGKILSAADLRKETKEAKAATERLSKEVAEIKKEMRSKESEREKEIEKIDKKKAVEEEAIVVHASGKAQFRQKNGFQRCLSAIGHIGLGKERMRFVQNLAMMLNAGLPLIDSLHTLLLETRAKPMRKVLQKIIDAVENGSPLWRAMEQQSFFSLHALALVRIGEEAGDLAQNMEYLALQEEKDHELKSKVKMAMIYPTIVLTIMFIIVIGLGMFVLPNLISVLYSLNVPLPFVTRLVIMFTDLFTNYGTIAVPGSIAGFILTIIVAKYTPLKVVFQWIMFRIPGIGRLASEATIARFGVILGGLLKAGVPVIEAMQSLVEVTPIIAYKRLYSQMLDHITIGDSFSKSFSSIRHSEKLLPPSVQQLVITGEKSGALADIMLKIADIYDKKASETAQKLPVILEPMLLLFIGGLVGTIAFAIIVPIYSIVGSVGR